MSPQPTTEDRIWAVLAHLAALSMGMGILLPVVGWSDQRRKSSYSSFQCLQALGYQSVGFTVWVLSYLVILILAAILVLAFARPEAGPGPASVPLLVLLFLVLFGGFAIYLVLPVIAAVACALGKDYRYPILGHRLARYLQYEPPAPGAETQLQEAREFRWVAAMGHFSILVMLWGMLAPLAAWMLQGKNSSFLKIQSIQTLLYQAITVILYVIAGFLYVAGVGLALFLPGGPGTPELNSVTSVASLLVLGLTSLCAVGLLLLVPLLHILGQWAGYRVLKGDDYLYPVIGRLVQERNAGNDALEETAS